MSDASPLFEFTKLVLVGGIGAASALLGQYFSNKSAERRHERDLQQRVRRLDGIVSAEEFNRAFQAVTTAELLRLDTDGFVLTG